MNVFTGLFIFALLLTSAKIAAQSDESLTATHSINETELSQAQLAQLLAPVALYPDTLLTHILIAATYPLEVVQATRWLDNNKRLSSQEKIERIQAEGWDASIIALTQFPSVMSRLNDDLTWTEQLGNAFLADEAQVLNSIQQLRHKAQVAGNLSKMSNMDISYDDDNIVIEPSDPQVIYVPYYDTRVVYGHWYWQHFPPVYWVTPKHLHVSHYHRVYRPFYWHTGIHISQHFFFGAFHWHNRHVVVVHHHKPYYRHGYYSRRQIVSSTGAKRWHHKPNHRRGVAYSSQRVAKQYRGKRVAHKSVSPKANRHNIQSHKAMPHKVTPYSRSNERRILKQGAANKRTVKHNTQNAKTALKPRNQSVVTLTNNHATQTTPQVKARRQKVKTPINKVRSTDRDISKNKATVSRKNNATYANNRQGVKPHSVKRKHQSRERQR